ncbi:MAG: hypothetical protein ABUT20_31855 [Bacteroidota bacterium]
MNEEINKEENEENANRKCLPSGIQGSADVHDNEKAGIESLPLDEYPQTINNKQQTASMEVHHHAHHEHGKKNWKSYIWEFFMLFLAVFCGFLAEYQLEHVVEHNREREYIHSLIADLKSDQQGLTQHILEVNGGLLMMDSLINILNNPTDIEVHTGKLYFLARLAPRLQPLLSNNRTFEQLKNSGNFRLIRNLEVSNKIMTYYEKLPIIRLLESINETEFTEYKKAASKIFDPAIFLKMEGDDDEIRQTNNNPSLRSTDKELLQELSVFSVYMHGTKKGIMANCKILKKEGAELLGYLEKEYHLE